MFILPADLLGLCSIIIRSGFECSVPMHIVLCACYEELFWESKLVDHQVPIIVDVAFFCLIDVMIQL